MKKRCAIGVDLGGTNLRVALTSNNGTVIKKLKEPTPRDILNAIIKLIEPVFSQDIVGIGLGIAGLIDRKNGRVLSSPNLPAVEGISLVKKIKGRFKVPVFIENDANCAALGEKWAGAGRELSNFVLLTLGTGIGGGIIKDNKLLKVAAEIGHMTIHTDGEKCHCGNTGCLEAYAAARGMLSKVESALRKGRESKLGKLYNGDFYKLTAKDIYRTAIEGDSLSRETLVDAGRYLGVGIANIVNVMSPEAVILGGGLIGAWDIYVQEAIKETSKRAFKDLVEEVKILPALLGDDAGVIGSAGLVFHQHKRARK